VKLSHPQPSILPHPSLGGIKVSLSWESVVAFEGPDWKLSATPSLSISSPQLIQGEWLQLLRGEDGEIGISFDKGSSRHFFLLGSVPSPKFSIKFKASLFFMLCYVMYFIVFFIFFIFCYLLFFFVIFFLFFFFLLFYFLCCSSYIP
jgi:hypothetical protein